ncbi:MAG: hypothetical protein MUP76_08425 [Acidimicrobiia bacterium]|nr:hypothetical protein [Acidimicrobiia bacterium]
MTIQVSNTTLDIITRSAFKYRVITRQAADMFGSELQRLNLLAMADVEPDVETPDMVNYVRTAFERKVKRNAIDGALRCWIDQVKDLPGITDTAAWKLVQAVKAKNDVKMGLITMTPAVYNEDGEWVSDGERIVAAAPDHGFWDAPDDDRDSVMIRSREEREAEQRRVMEARMAEREAAIAARANDPADDDSEDYSDEDEWDEDDDA